MANDKPRCRLYLITPPRLEPEVFADTLELALAAGDVACLQLRLPDAGEAVVRAAARALRPVCIAHDVAFLIEADAGLAKRLGADGVHVGDARAVRGARAIMGDGIVGASCGGSRHAAMEAAEAGADYVSFGAMFPSPTLPNAAVADADIIGWWSELMEVPCVAVGGVTAANCPGLVQAGADFLAVCSAVWNDPAGPAAAVAALNEAVERAGASC